MENHLEKYCTWKELAKIAKTINGAPLGLSPKMELNDLTRTKAALAGYIAKRWSKKEVETALEALDYSGWKFGYFEPVSTPNIPEQATIPEWVNSEEETINPEEQTTQAADAEAEKYRKIKEILGGTDISEEKVQEMIEAALDKRPVKREKIIIKDGVERKVKGHPHKMIAVACRKVSANINTMLFGAPGCGKTFLARQVAESMGLNYGWISCNGGTTPEDLFGRLLPTGENGRFEWIDSPLMKLVENGGLFLWDELDALPADMLFTCQMLLSDGRMTLPARIHQPEIVAHKDFRAMATCNSLGNGGGVGLQREIQDDAAFDRWKAGRIFCDYDIEVERQIVHPAVFAWAIEIREKIVVNNLNKLMTTRNMVDFSKDADAGAVRKDWEDSYFMDWSRDEMNKAGRKAAA